ncbi:MAG: N-acetylneuraminate synthase [Lachnospiraceae bacterium]|nr:N-acetylneuraminate synthase [Lachnospiraceae bacterium]
MEHVFIIAEAGDNHNGNFDLALQLVDKAVEAGADCVKFQTFVTENVVSKFAEKAEYQKENTGADENQYEMIKKLELSFDQFREIQAYCQKKGIIFLSTPFDLDSIDFLQEINIPFWKIPSGEITNLPYLIRIAKTGKDIILSTGMSTMEEIASALDILKCNGAGKITLLHCNTEYPTPYEDVNLRAMKTLKDTFQVPVGYSDHTQGIEVPIAAVASGACVIEKHFTLDKTMEGPDHKASLEPDELKNMVSAIRNIEKAMGAEEKFPTKSEKKNITIARKSIVAKCDIKKGEQLTEDNLYVKRPGDGISPMKWFDVIGTTAIRNFKEDELIEL